MDFISCADKDGFRKSSHISSVRRLLAVVTERASKLADWLVPKNGKADLIDRSAISSTQQEVLGM